MKTRARLPSIVISFVVHAVILSAMAMLTWAVQIDDDTVAIDTLFEEERTQEEFVQELDTQVEAAKTLNIVAGDAATEIGISTDVGGAGGTGGGGGTGGAGGTGGSGVAGLMAGQDFPGSNVTVNVGIGDGPALETLGDDLGEGEVTGEVGAIVAGYGAALDRLTAELMRMMRSQKLMVVWLFDESLSMKDDQEEIRQRFGRIYEELKLVEKNPNVLGESGRGKRLQDILLTAVTSFGKTFHEQTRKPTNNIEEVLAAIANVPVDPDGDENMCFALDQVLKKYGGMTRGDRKVVLVVVSDESGDDGDYVEDVLHQAKSQRVPIYILGREAVFGSLYAHVLWTQPISGVVHKLPIRRGPETPFAEQLQYDGYRRRYDAHMSGFGPYEQVRLCRETGGIFFQLPHEQTDLNDLDSREFDMLDVREYLPFLESRREYVEERDASDFRRAVWDVIVMLNPYDPNSQNLELPEVEYFAMEPARWTAQVTQRIRQTMHILSVMQLAQQRLESVRPLRAKEESVRWRANYDLIAAQLYAYRVRLFEYALGLDQFAKSLPSRTFEDPRTNAWSISGGAEKLIMPDDQQQKFLKVSPEDIQQAHYTALEQFGEIQKLHPNTPWARRAEWELSRNFGVNFNAHYFAPSTTTPPTETPPPPPKL